MAKAKPGRRKVSRPEDDRDPLDWFLSSVGIPPHICDVADCPTMARYRRARKDLESLIRTGGNGRRYLKPRT